MRNVTSPRQSSEKTDAKTEINKDQIKTLLVRLDHTVKKKFEFCTKHKQTSMNAVIDSFIRDYVNDNYDVCVKEVARASSRKL